MKTLNFIGWSSGCIGVVIVLLGIISGIIGKNILPINHVLNYFNVANSFFLITIALFIVVNRCECNKK
jgi:DMSO/TMAO reductase YedYZ heme-binding membrane subunit